MWSSTSTTDERNTVPTRFRVCDANGNSIGTPAAIRSFLKASVLLAFVQLGKSSTGPFSLVQKDSSENSSPNLSALHVAVGNHPVHISTPCATQIGRASCRERV